MQKFDDFIQAVHDGTLYADVEYCLYSTDGREYTKKGYWFFHFITVSLALIMHVFTQKRYTFVYYSIYEIISLSIMQPSFIINI